MIRPQITRSKYPRKDWRGKSY